MLYINTCINSAILTVCFVTGPQLTLRFHLPFLVWKANVSKLLTELYVQQLASTLHKSNTEMVLHPVAPPPKIANIVSVQPTQPITRTQTNKVFTPHDAENHDATSTETEITVQHSPVVHCDNDDTDAVSLLSISDHGTVFTTHHKPSCTSHISNRSTLPPTAQNDVKTGNALWT